MGPLPGSKTPFCFFYGLHGSFFNYFYVYFLVRVALASFCFCKICISGIQSGFHGGHVLDVRLVGHKSCPQSIYEIFRRYIGNIL